MSIDSINTIQFLGQPNFHPLSQNVSNLTRFTLTKSKLISKKDHLSKKINHKCRNNQIESQKLKKAVKKKISQNKDQSPQQTEASLSTKSSLSSNFQLQQITPPRKFEDQKSQVFNKEEKKINNQALDINFKQEFKFKPMTENIESIIYKQRQQKTRKLCPKYQSVRSQFIVYIREKTVLLKLSRQSCQLVIYYLDEYFSRNSYKQKQMVLIISTFFVIASKAIQQVSLNMSKVAKDNGVTLQSMQKMELKILKALQFKVTPTTYIPLLNQVALAISQNTEIGLNLFGENIQTYIIMRKIYYICQEIYSEMETIDIVSIKIAINFVLKKILSPDKLVIVRQKIIGEIIEDQNIEQLLNELYQQSVQKEKKFIQDFQIRKKYKNYGIFVNVQK